jgi:hypothetical protein
MQWPWKKEKPKRRKTSRRPTAKPTKANKTQEEALDGYHLAFLEVVKAKAERNEAIANTCDVVAQQMMALAEMFRIQKQEEDERKRKETILVEKLHGG